MAPQSTNKFATVKGMIDFEQQRKLPFKLRQQKGLGGKASRNLNKFPQLTPPFLVFLIASAYLIKPTYGLTALGTGIFQITTYNPPAIQCSAFCMYQINPDFNLISQCTASYSSGNGFCKKCDPLFFRPVANGVTFFCIPHLYNGQSLHNGNSILLANKYGFVDGTSNYQNFHAPLILTNLAYHYAVRIRFSIYLWRWRHDTYIYPLRYTIDQVGYTYNQTLDKYWSPFDIITSSLQNHSNSQVSISFRLLNVDPPYNTVCGPGIMDGTCWCKDCNCGTGTCLSCCSSSNACCDKRYIQVNDLLVFVSLCPTGCLNCTSATYCTICDFANGYYRNPVDHTCYLTCPQATYKDDVTLFLNNAGYNQLQHICSACPATCLQCTTAVICTKCYAYGRNQSFLYNNNCINPCINGYDQNYTTHVCYCSPEYFYEDTVNLICYRCALECVNCFGPTNLNCTYCEKGYYLAYLTTQCLIQCPVGQYKNDLTRACSPCDSTCSDCEEKSTLCTECFLSNPSRYLLGQQCLTWCPLGYQWNNITHKCNLCDLFTYSLHGKCADSCPSMYSTEKRNRSCIHLSLIGFTYELIILSVNILSHGKLIKFQILAQDGLNASSYEAVIKRSYFNAQVLYKDQMVKSIKGVSRNLANTNLPIRNLQYINNRIIFVTEVPPNLDYRKSFQIVFMETIAGTQNIVYGNYTNVYNVGEHPQLIKEYFLFTAKSLSQIIMVPFVTIAMLLFTLQIKGVYDCYMELLRMVQLLGLLLYSSFPVGKHTFYFLLGCSYANLDFVPNLYAMAAKPESVNSLTSYFLTADDMDFIRLNGSVLFFGVLWATVLLIAKFLIQVKESRLKFMVSFGVDLMEVKILHSFWSALLFVIVNYDTTNFSIFATFTFALLLFMGVNARRYSVWRETKDLSPLYVWRLIGTLLLCFVSLANELLITLIFCVSLGATLAEFYLLHSTKYLIDINSLNSQNYMDEKTYKILNEYDKEVKYSFSISVRNTMKTILPVITSLFASVLILLKEYQIQSLIFTSSLTYVLLIMAIVISVLIFKFLRERRSQLAQNKLIYLRTKFSNMNSSSYTKINSQSSAGTMMSINTLSKLHDRQKRNQ